MQVTRKQHYISRGILKHFQGENNKVYELYIPKSIISNSDISSVMMQKFVYEHPDLPQNILEDTFAQMESKVIPKIDKLIDEIEKCYKNKESCVNIYHELRNIMPYAMVFYFRSGALLQEYEFSSNNPKIERVEKMLDNILDKSYVKALCKTLLDCYDCAILINEEGKFLISDQYISTVALKFKMKFTNASNRQIGMKETLVLLPLSAKFYIAFFLGNVPEFIKRDKFNILTKAETEMINNVIFDNSYVKCVGRNQGEVSRVSKKTDRTQYSPTGFIEKHKNGNVVEYVTKKEVYMYEEDKDFDKNYIEYLSNYVLKIKNKISRNTLCICGSNKKYKKCCMKKYERAKNIQYAIEHPNSFDYRIPGATVEYSIQVFSGKATNMPEGHSKDLLNQIEMKMKDDKSEK